MKKSIYFNAIGSNIPLQRDMQKSYEKSEDISSNYIQFYMKKSIYFNAIGSNLPLQRNIQKFVLNSKFAFFE